MSLILSYLLRVYDFNTLSNESSSISRQTTSESMSSQLSDANISPPSSFDTLVDKLLPGKSNESRAEILKSLNNKIVNQSYGGNRTLYLIFILSVIQGLTELLNERVYDSKYLGIKNELREQLQKYIEYLQQFLSNGMTFTDKDRSILNKYLNITNDDKLDKSIQNIKSKAETTLKFRGVTKNVSRFVSRTTQKVRDVVEPVRDYFEQAISGYRARGGKRKNKSSKKSKNISRKNKKSRKG